MKNVAFAAAAALQLVACGRSPYDQDVVGTLTEAGGPAGARHVKFTSQETQVPCGQPGAETTTDSHGRFRIKLQYQPTWFELVDVVIHPYALCMLQGTEWRPLWNQTNGPAPRRLELSCTLDAEAHPSCQSIWDGYVWPKHGT